MQDGEVIADGENVLLQIDIDGKPRRVCVTREAIEDKLKLPPDHAATFSPEERCDFVRRHLPNVIAAVRRKFYVTNEDADVVLIGTKDL